MFQPDIVHRLKELEPEKTWLMKLVVKRDLEIEVMKEIATKWWHGHRPAAACALMRVAHLALSYRSENAVCRSAVSC